MGVLDVFESDAFTFASLTKAISQMGYVPRMLGRMPGLFEPVPVRTKEVWLERIGDQPALIQTSARGTPPAQVGGDRRDAKAFNTVRLALGSRVTPDELLAVRRFGSEIDIKTAESEIARRMFKMSSRHELTMENLRLGLVTAGIVYDADGSTIVNWNNEFASAPNGARALSAISETAFNLAAGTVGTVTTNCNAIVRAIKRNLSMVSNSDTLAIDPDDAQIVAVVGDSFYDQLVTHAEVRTTFVNWRDAARLRQDGSPDGVGAVWQPFSFAGVEWINYRGTDDTSGAGSPGSGNKNAAGQYVSMGVDTNHAKFFPRFPNSASSIFQMAYAPGERFFDLGAPGQERYAMIVRDMQRDMWVDVETYTYPLPVCVVPQALASGRAGA